MRGGCPSVCFQADGSGMITESRREKLDILAKGTAFLLRSLERD